MKKIFLLLVITPLLTSCVANGFPKVGAFGSTDCGSVRGKTTTNLKYGIKKEQDFIEMKWKSFIGKKTAFRIKLKPTKGYENKLVEIIGKWGQLPGGANTPFGWLTKSGTAAGLTNSTIVLCVPDNLPEGTEFKFDIKIQDVGDMDPRAEVTW